MLPIENIEAWWGSIPPKVSCKAAWAEKSEKWMKQFEKDVRLGYQLIKCGGQGRVLQIELRLCQHAWCLIPRLTNVQRPNPNTFLHIVATDAGLKDLKFRHQFAKNTFFLEILTAQNLDAIYVINNVTWLPLLKL